jgi:hypothetical protein
MNGMSQRFKMGYGVNRRIHNDNSYNDNSSLPLRTFNTYSNNNEIKQYIKKRILQERAYKMYKMKLQEKEIKEIKEIKEKETELIFSEIYKNEEKITDKSMKSEHFKDYETDKEKLEIIQELIDTDTDTDIDSD